MRSPILLLAALPLLSTMAFSPTAALAKKPAPTPAATAPATTKPVAPAAAASSCPYLTESGDKDTSSTKAVYNSSSKTLNIQVDRAVPDMFWGIAESMTRERANKILEECPSIALVQINFQSGQKMTVQRTTTAAK
jgi:hypothetical protein